MVDDCLETGGSSKAVATMKGIEIPDDTTAIFAATCKLIGHGVVDLNGRHSRFVLLHRGDEIATIVEQFPHANGTIFATRHEPTTIMRARQRSDRPMMRIGSLADESAALRAKDADRS